MNIDTTIRTSLKCSSKDQDKKEFINKHSVAFFNLKGLHGLFMFVWGIDVPLENFPLIWKRHRYQWKASNFNIYLALMATEQWMFLSVPHFMCHGEFIYNGYLQNRVHDTRICCRAFGIGAITILILYLRLRSVATGDRTLIVRMRGERYTN